MVEPWADGGVGPFPERMEAKELSIWLTSSRVGSLPHTDWVFLRWIPCSTLPCEGMATTTATREKRATRVKERRENMVKDDRKCATGDGESKRWVVWLIYEKNRGP